MATKKKTEALTGISSIQRRESSEEKEDNIQNEIIGICRSEGLSNEETKVVCIIWKILTGEYDITKEKEKARDARRSAQVSGIEIGNGIGTNAED